MLELNIDSKNKRLGLIYDDEVCEENQESYILAKTA